MTDLREAIPGTPTLPLPKGVKQGANDQGSVGWFGMRALVGTRRITVISKVFALDTLLDLPPRAGRAELLKAMPGYVCRPQAR